MNQGNHQIAEHDAIANALGISSQELWDARAAGKSIPELAKEKSVDLTKVVDAALAAHTAQLDARSKREPSRRLKLRR